LLPLDIPIRIGRDEAQRLAAEELAKAKYGGTPDWLVSVADRFDRLTEWLVALAIRLLLGRGPGDGVNFGFLIAATVLLVAIGLVVWRVGLPRWKRRRRDAAVDLDPSRPAADYRRQADEHAQRGDWASAVRDRFRGLVRELEVRTILDVRPARTAWEAAYSAARVLPASRDWLQQGAESFNAVVYGDRPADQAAYQQMVRVDQQVVAAADTTDWAADDVAAVTR
jgi:hypothetical protein